MPAQETKGSSSPFARRQKMWPRGRQSRFIPEQKIKGSAVRRRSMIFSGAGDKGEQQPVPPEDRK